MNKKVIFITGATRGIGRNMANYFAQREFTVVGSGRDEQQLKEVRDELLQYSGDHRMVAMDVTNLEDVKSTLKYVIDTFGKIDVWVNNAGSFQAIGPTWEVSPDLFKQDMETNVIGTYHCVATVIPFMLKQQHGKIINIVGGGTLDAFPYGNGYGTSKTAIARFTENLANELQHMNVEVYALDPGLNDTDMTKYQRTSEEGKKYLANVEKLFENKVDVSPEHAPGWVEKIIDDQLQPFQGRIVTVYDNLDDLKREASETSDTDYRYLRWKDFS
ncbi:SDR family NAD(P)-dependent oxidoreductase [Gracilibacillus salitolerans]|uniref:SDR family NAD(P)-dependent oxidoreductase n=1 Tax=Gracilibacillus salitolerans TaxID=2663022 RepID=A0A5Q2TKY7_9BACI|nr:SDR family oxidoreductase [Gracilibacillus salitolerans]QGH35416.1 SDR family NAD(P)-dependent oxidoreductase [Gracilibacillus salitolerans]